MKAKVNHVIGAIVITLILAVSADLYLISKVIAISRVETLDITIYGALIDSIVLNVLMIAVVTFCVCLLTGHLIIISKMIEEKRKHVTEFQDLIDLLKKKATQGRDNIRPKEDKVPTREGIVRPDGDYRKNFDDMFKPKEN